MTTTNRLAHIVADSTLAVAGLAGLTSAAGAPAAAGSGGTHDAMHGMMDAMHGPGTADRIHAVDGGEQMMDDCVEMQDMMRGMRSQMMGDR